MIIPLLMIVVLVFYLLSSDALVARAAALLVFMTPAWGTRSTGLDPDETFGLRA